MFKKFLVGIVMIAMIATPAICFADSESQSKATGTALIDQSGQNNSVKNDSQRYLPNVGITPIPGTNGFFTSPTPDSSF